MNIAHTNFIKKEMTGRYIIYILYDGNLFE